MVSPAGLGRAPNRAPSNGCIGPSGFAVTQGPDNRKTVGHRHQIGGVGTWTTITHPPPALATSSCGEHRGARLLARTRPARQPRQQRGRLRGRLPVPRDARQQRPRTPSATLPGTAARWRTTVSGRSSSPTSSALRRRPAGTAAVRRACLGHRPRVDAQLAANCGVLQRRRPPREQLRPEGGLAPPGGRDLHYSLAFCGSVRTIFRTSSLDDLTRCASPATPSSGPRRNAASSSVSPPASRRP